MTTQPSPYSTPLAGAKSAVTVPLFEAVLTPHRSLSRAGFRLLMALAAAVAFGAGMMFLIAGAWPVTGFFGLDVLLIYLAFKASYRSGRLSETVRVTRDRVIVRRVPPSGRPKTWTLPSYWTRVGVDDAEAHHCRVTLNAEGRSVVVGSFLSPEERLDLAEALRRALLRSRCAPAAR